MTANPSVEATQVLAHYPRIYFACHTRHVRDDLGGHVLSAHQAGILSHLDDVEPTRLTELARHMGVGLSSMSLSVGRLVRQGYVLRTRHEQDGRAVALRLTEAGVRMRDAQTVLEPARVEGLLAHLDDERRRRALEGLALLAQAADALLAGESSAGPRLRAGVNE